VKILGFAHLAICFSTRQRNLVNQFFRRTLNYELIENHPKKYGFMKFHDKSHRISLEVPGIEICLYDHTSLVSISRLHEILDPISVGNVGDFCIDSGLDLRFRTFLGTHGKLIENDLGMKLVSSPFMKSLTFKKRTNCPEHFRTNRFLDTPGVASVAFYADTMLTEEECVQQNIEYMEPFGVHFESRSFLVQVFKIGGVNVELISRPRNR